MVWKWIGLMLLCTWIGVVNAYGLAFLLSTYPRDFVIGWAPPQEGHMNFSPFDVAAGNCVVYGAPLGLLSGIAAVFADAIYQSRRIY